jgi:hypothetical protein
VRTELKDLELAQTDATKQFFITAIEEKIRTEISLGVTSEVFAFKILEGIWLAIYCVYPLGRLNSADDDDDDEHDHENDEGDDGDDMKINFMFINHLQFIVQRGWWIFIPHQDILTWHDLFQY